MNIDPPPAVYDFEPRNYIVMRAPKEVMASYCGRPIVACALPKYRAVVIEDGIVGALFDALLRHERAHINGWIH